MRVISTTKRSGSYDFIMTPPDEIQCAENIYVNAFVGVNNKIIINHLGVVNDITLSVEDLDPSVTLKIIQAITEYLAS
jgi:hypothetical protein